MENNYENIIKLLEPLRMRIFFNRLIKWLIRGLLAGGVISLLLSIFSLVLPFTFDLISVLQIIFLSIAIVGPVAVIALPDNKEIINKADTFDLKERLITTLELRDKYDPIAMVQRQDAYTHVINLDFSRLCPVKIDMKKIGVVFCVFAIAASLTLVETEARSDSKKIEQLKDKASKSINELENIKHEANLNSQLTEEEKKTISKKIDSINKELIKARSSEDMKKALFRAENETKKLSDTVLENDLSRVADEFLKNESTKWLGEALKNYNAEDMKKAIDKSKDTLKNMSMGDKKKLADDIKKLADEIKNNPKVIESLNKLSNAMRGNNDEVSKSLDDFGNALEQASEKDPYLNNSLKNLRKQITNKMNKSISDSRKEMGLNKGNGASGDDSQSNNSDDDMSNNGQGMQKGQQGIGQKGQQSGQQGSSQQGQGQSGQQGSEQQGQGQSGQQGSSQQGQGQSGQQGSSQQGQGQSGQQGNGQQGQGQSGQQGSSQQGQGQQQGGQGTQMGQNGQQGIGGGVGRGSGNNEAGAGSPDSGYASREQGRKKVSDYESIYTAKRIGGDTKASNVSGQKSNDGSSTYQESNKDETQIGSIVPYDKVITDYKNEAVSGVDELKIPSSMKDLVKNYFSSLEE